MDNASPNSGLPRKKRSRYDDLIVDLVLDDSNSFRAKPPYAPRSPGHQRFLEEARDRYLAWEAEQDEIDRQTDADSPKPHPDPSADSSDSAPTIGT